MDLFPREAPATMLAALKTRLGEREFAPVSFVAGACNVSVTLVLDGWIQEGLIEATNVGSKDRPYYQVYVPSVLRFYESRLVGAETENRDQRAENRGQRGGGR
jgi:hypothetical protein